MASLTWPPTLPRFPVKDGFSEKRGLNILRTPMDKGPAKQRRLGRRATPIEFVFEMHRDQVAILDEFVNVTLSGVKRFDITHPRTNSAIEVRIVPSNEGDLYVLTPLGGPNWRVTLALEVLP